MQQAVDALKPEGATRFYDAVAEALEMLDRESGRRVVLALTDGEDTFSQSATLESVIASGQRLGLPVYTLGLGTEEEIESGDLRRLAAATRGQYYPARNADELRGNLRTDRRADPVELFDGLSERSQAGRRHAAAGAHLLSRQHDGGRRDGHLHSGNGRSRRRLVAAFPRAAGLARGHAGVSRKARPPRGLKKCVSTVVVILMWMSPEMAICVETIRGITQGFYRVSG